MKYLFYTLESAGIVKIYESILEERKGSVIIYFVYCVALAMAYFCCHDILDDLG
jgi:hypothetical protein